MEAFLLRQSLDESALVEKKKQVFEAFELEREQSKFRAEDRSKEEQPTRHASTRPLRSICVPLMANHKHKWQQMEKLTSLAVKSRRVDVAKCDWAARKSSESCKKMIIHMGN
ncbi:hypothetical protein KSP39_PZI009708 [Platanthera zijinensis]|uniref:Uncharacterized protein n=1 Tax=Platanthera zijinensis TaxID=2320716 RepID=A0AAP0G6N8_9ASPA